MTKYFGTDGVRGIANKELSPEMAFRLGRTGGYVLTQHKEDASRRPLVWLLAIREFLARCWPMH